MSTSDATLTQRQLQVLGEIAEIGLEIARVAEAKAKADGADVNACAMAYARVARAVRQTVMLQSRLINDRRLQARCADIRAGEERRTQVEGIVERIVRDACGEDEDGADTLIAEACERLEDDDIYGLLSRPASEVVAQICGDLGLDPDWTALALEAWAREEIEGGSPGAPLARVPRPPSAASPACGEGGELCAGQRFGQHANARRRAGWRSGGEGIPPPSPFELRT